MSADKAFIDTNIFISEDMQDGLIIDKKLQIVNIFNHTNLLEKL